MKELSLECCISLAYFNVNDYQQATISTSELINSYEENHHDNVQVLVKALFTRARSYAAMAELELAYKDLHKACKLDPQSHKLRDELAAVKKKIKQAEEKQKQMFKAAFEVKEKDAEQKPQQNQQQQHQPTEIKQQTPNQDQEINEGAIAAEEKALKEAPREGETKIQIEGILKNHSHKKSDDVEKKKKLVKLPKPEKSDNDFTMNILSAVVLIGLVIGSAYLTTSIMSKSRDRI